MSTETDHVTLERSRFRQLEGAVAIGQELELTIRGRVRRIEADQIDVSGFDPEGGRAVLEGDVFVELSVVRVSVELPVDHEPTRIR